MNTAIQRFRYIALLEGASFVVLLLIAMPLKYFADMPLAVRVVGWIHGLLFVAFLLALLSAQRHAGWTVGRLSLFFVAGLLPFGPFFVDHRLREEQS